MINILKKVEIFSKFGDKQLLALSKLGSRKIIAPNEHLFKKGDMGKGLYVVLRGHFITSYKGKEHTFKQGEVLSPLSLVDENKHQLSVRSDKKGEVFFFSKDNFDKLVEKSPKFAQTLEDQIFKNFLKHSNKVVNICIKE